MITQTVLKKSSPAFIQNVSQHSTTTGIQTLLAVDIRHKTPPFSDLKLVLLQI